MLEVLSADIFAYSFIAVCGVVGWFKGLSRQLFAWSVWIVGLYWMYHNASWVVSLPLFVSWMENAVLRTLVVVLFLFLAVVLVSVLGQKLLTAVVSALGLGVLDGFLGAFLGMLQAGLLLFCAVVLLDKTEFRKDKWWQKSDFVTRSQRVIPKKTHLYVDQVVEGVSKWHGRMDRLVMRLMDA